MTLWRPIRSLMETVKARREATRARREAERARCEAERVRREAERARRRKLHQHWLSLSGIEFEREVGSLYSYLGYHVESTPRSGDRGIDLIFRKNGETILIQCKGRKSPVGPAVARELLGSLVAFPGGANGAILACTGGFTRGVYEFVHNHPIELIDASDLVALSEGVYVPNWEFHD